MAQVEIKERIYVDDKGRRVSESYRGGKRLAAVPGDLVSEKRAAELEVGPAKGLPKPADKSRDQGEDKSRQPGDNKGK